MCLRRDEIDEEGKEELEAHVNGGALHARTPQAAHDDEGDHCDCETERDTPEELDDEGPTGICNRKVTGHRRGNRKLERDDAGSIIEQRLAQEGGLLTRPELDGLAERRNGDGIGGAKRRT